MQSIMTGKAQQQEQSVLSQAAEMNTDMQLTFTPPGPLAHGKVPPFLSSVKFL